MAMFSGELYMERRTINVNDICGLAIYNLKVGENVIGDGMKDRVFVCGSGCQFTHDNGIAQNWSSIC